jgi:hypothetical protein
VKPWTRRDRIPWSGTAIRSSDQVTEASNSTDRSPAHRLLFPLPHDRFLARADERIRWRRASASSWHGAIPAE